MSKLWANALTPANDFFRTIYFEDLDPTTFAPVPVTTGTVTAFLATSNEPDAVAADSSLSVSATHIGVANPTADQFPLGTWGISFDATVLNEALLDALFGVTRVAYLIIVRTGHTRLFDKVPYVRYAAADASMTQNASSLFIPYGIVSVGSGLYTVTPALPGDLQFFRMPSGTYRAVFLQPSAGVYHDVNGNIVSIDLLATARVVPVLLGNGSIKLVAQL